jgi:hypothetical protein
MSLMRPVAFGEALTAGTRLTLFSDDELDRFFTVIKFWMDATSGVALELKTGVPTYQVEDEEGRIHLLIHLPIEEKDEGRWCLWRPDQEGGILCRLRDPELNDRLGRNLDLL